MGGTEPRASYESAVSLINPDQVVRRLLISIASSLFNLSIPYKHRTLSMVLCFCSLRYNTIMKHKLDDPGFKPEFPGQHPDEGVELVFRQHPVVLRKALIGGLFFVLLTEMPLLIFPAAFSLDIQILLGGIAVCLLVWFYYWMGWYYSIYILTDLRLIDIRQKGFFNRTVREVGLDKVQSINYHIKGLQATLLKYGDITVQTYTGDWVLKTVHHPHDVYGHMMAISRLVDSSSPTS